MPVNNVNYNMYNPNDLFFGMYEVNFKYYDMVNKRWSIMHTIGYTDAEVSITPTTNYAEFNALVPQITIANNVSGYMKELRFTIAEIMLDKLARILGGQDIQSTTGAQQTFTQFWSEADFESLCVVYHGDPQGRRRLKLIGYVNDNSLLVEQGTVSGNTFTPASSGADITSQFTIDMINGEFYLTPVNQNQLVQLSGSNTHVRLTYNYMTLTMKDLGLIDNVNKLLKYFAFVILGRNDNAGDGRWLVFYIPRAQISAMPTPRFAPNEYPKFEMAFKALASIQPNVSPFDVQAQTTLVRILEIPATQVVGGNTINITRSMILSNLGRMIDENII